MKISKIKFTMKNLKKYKLILNLAPPVQNFPMEEEEYQRETLVSPWSHR